MKILFLDFVGVLGPRTFFPGARHDLTSMNREALAKLHVPPQDEIRRVIDTTGCKIVLSTAWRSFNGDTAENAEILLKSEVIPSLDVVIGQTPDLSLTRVHFTRGDEIQTWLRAESGVECFAIVDDAPMAGEFSAWDQYHTPYTEPDPFLTPRFVLTMGHIGCTTEDADRLIALLGASHG